MRRKGGRNETARNKWAATPFGVPPGVGPCALWRVAHNEPSTLAYALQAQGMSFSIDIHGRVDRLLSSAADGAALHEVLAEAGRHVVRKHFRDLSLERNRPGKPGGKQAFYSVARDSVVSEHSEESAGVGVTGPQGIRLRLLGGVTRPKPPNKFLAMPVDDRVRGVKAAEAFDTLDLRPMIRADGQGGILYSAKHHPKVAKGERVDALYALAREATHEADPTVLPRADAIARAAGEAAREHIARAVRREGGAQ